MVPRAGQFDVSEIFSGTLFYVNGGYPSGTIFLLTINIGWL